MVKYKNNESNYQDFLKAFAIVTMLIDHLGLYIFPEHEWMRFVGRTAMPIFLFFSGYNFKNFPNILVLLFGSMLCIAYFIQTDYFTTANILISIFLGQLYIYIFKNFLQSFYASYFQVVLLGLLYFITADLFDYGTIAISIILLGYMAKTKQINLKLSIATSLALSLFHSVYIFPFSIFYVLLESAALFLLMNATSFSHTIRLKINWLSRNSLSIYFVHVLILHTIWYYRWIGWISW